MDWGEKDVYVHANRKAPRCLPCDYRDPLENTTDIWGWNAISVSIILPVMHAQKQSYQLQHTLNLSASSIWTSVFVQKIVDGNQSILSFTP